MMAVEDVMMGNLIHIKTKSRYWLKAGHRTGTIEWCQTDDMLTCTTGILAYAAANITDDNPVRTRGQLLSAFIGYHS
jgi:hypothetical protein